jgi:hypothetical protein
MSSHGSIDIAPHIEALRTRTVPGSVRMGAAALVVVGLISFGFGLMTNPAWAWGAWLVATLFVLALAQGGVVFSVIMTLTWARWGRPLKRIAETFGFFLPVAYVMLLIFLVGGNGIYPWHEGTFVVDQPIALAPHSPGAWASKEIWLSLPFFIGRQIVGLGFLMALSALYIRSSLRPDLIAAKARLGDAAPGWWNSIIGGAGDVDAESEKSAKTQATLGVFIGIFYALIFSMVAFDLVMSLSPWWYANMFGGWFFASSFWIALATIGITGLVARDWLGIRKLITQKTMHDLGKLCLAFCMFWAYTTFAQILPIWYANMPEETDFLLIRMNLPQWSWLARTVVILCFLTPFTVLVSRGIKKMKWPFIGILVVICVGVFLERTLLVMPSIYFEDTFPWEQLLVTSLGTWLGALGAFALVVSHVLAKVPAITITDEKMETHPWDVHVHSLDAAHH